MVRVHLVGADDVDVPLYYWRYVCLINNREHAEPDNVLLPHIGGARVNEIFTVAFIRAVMLAAITGALAFLMMWQTTTEIRELLIAALTPFFTVILGRGLGEGTYDTKRESNFGTTVYEDGKPTVGDAMKDKP